MRARRILAFTLIVLIALVTPLVACQGCLLSTKPSTTRITILHTNDTHAALDEVARRATKVNQIRSEVGEDNMFLLDAGDVFTGTLYSTLFQGKADLWFMNNMRYDAMCLGNHEFDKGPEVLAEFVGEANFAVLCANFDFSAETTLTGKVKPWVIMGRGGDRFGFFGLTSDSTGVTSSPGPSIVINDHITAARQVVSELRGKGINKIIALTHIGWENDLRLAREVEGIDVIIGGDSHTVPVDYPTIVVGNATPTLIAQAGSGGELLGRLDVTFNKAGIVQSCGGSQLVPINDAIEPEAASSAKLVEYQETISILLNSIIGGTVVSLDGERAHVRSQETNLGNLLTDVMLGKAASLNATIAISNGGIIRASIPAGDISLGQILEVLPFGNNLVTIDLTGSQVIAALENGVSRVEEGVGRFPQVAGLRFTWNPGAVPDNRITSVEVKTAGGYQPIDPSLTYRVVTWNFLAGGGDGYTVLQQGSNSIALGFTDFEVLAEYVKANSPLAPQVEGRIIRMGSS